MSTLTRKILVGWFVFLLFLILFSKIARPENRENFKPKLSIKLAAGLCSTRVGDINSHLEDFNDFLSTALPFYEGSKLEKIDNLSSDLEGELRLNISSKFTIGLGIGYMAGKDKSYFQTAGIFPFTSYWIYYIPSHLIGFTAEPEFKTVPINLRVCYTLPLGAKTAILLSGGLGYYFSKCSLYKYNLNVPLDPARPDCFLVEISNKYDVNGNGLGLLGGVGFEFKLTDTLALVIEAQGRYARIKKLEGERTYYYYNSSSLLPELTKDEGILYIGERDLSDIGYGERCPDLIISPSKPTGLEYKNIREATLDLSGISLRIGIRITLL
ncbi:MAG: hypothetical protein OEY25_11980 [Candidatus Aminicenantes bacterium]|nr:hypothetical protein [Candidatus Aminicenantes bacterium]MDH5705852.1 hypothetical protein [Candidatus Aminicenantes bacterium]